MPSYLGGSIQISLSHADLSGTLTKNPLRRVGKETRDNLDVIDCEFGNAIRLQEVPIPSEEDGLSQRFLGKDRDMPFLMIKSGNSLYRRVSPSLENAHGNPSDPNRANKNSQVSSRSSSLTTSAQGSGYYDIERRALNLTVSLTARSFLPQPSYTVNPGRRPIVQDVKADIFFNGERCACTFFPARSLPGELSRSIEVFHGKRIALSTEKPWIIVPTGQNAEGNLRENKRSKLSSPGKRWAAINSLLLVEARTLAKDRDGNPTILAEYLRSLASLKVPGDLQGGQGSNYGVLDVVLISGLGKKDEAGNKYLLEPRSARLSRLDWSFPCTSTNASRKAPSPTPDFEIPIPSRPKRKLSPDCETPVIAARASRTSLSESTITLDSPLVAKRRRTVEKNRNTKPKLTLRFNTHSGSPALPPPVPPPTPNEAVPKPRQTKTSKAAGQFPMALDRSKQSKLAIIKRSPERLQHFPTAKAQTSRSLRSSTSSYPHAQINGFFNGDSPHSPAAPLTASPVPIINSATSEAPPTLLPLPPSKINEDCVITYDPHGVRQVRKERTGWFKESGVLLGVRYIVVPT